MDQSLELLIYQLNYAWDTLSASLKELTDEECWWKPTTNAWTLREIDGEFTYDYDLPERPTKPAPTTIAWLIIHLATCKEMYVEYAFKDAETQWDQLVIPKTEEDLLLYLKNTHEELTNQVKSLKNEELNLLKFTNWGEKWPLYQIVWTLIQHDIYHSAQVYYIRKLFKNHKFM